MAVLEQYVRLSDLAIVSHMYIQRKGKRYKRVPFDSDDLLAMGYAKLDESAPKGYRATGFAIPVGATYQREYADQTTEEAQQVKEGALAATDAKMARVVEDIYEALISKELLVPTDLPQAAQDVIADRKIKRGAL